MQKNWWGKSQKNNVDCDKQSSHQMNFTDKEVKEQEMLSGDSVSKCDLKKNAFLDHWWALKG